MSPARDDGPPVSVGTDLRVISTRAAGRLHQFLALPNVTVDAGPSSTAE